jgi:hypothetical protein
MARALKIRKEAATTWNCKVSEICLSCCLKQAHAENAHTVATKATKPVKYLLQIQTDSPELQLKTEVDANTIEQLQFLAEGMAAANPSVLGMGYRVYAIHKRATNGYTSIFIKEGRVSTAPRRVRSNCNQLQIYVVPSLFAIYNF